MHFDTAADSRPPVVDRTRGDLGLFRLRIPVEQPRQIGETPRMGTLDDLRIPNGVVAHLPAEIVDLVVADRRIARIADMRRTVHVAHAMDDQLDAGQPRRVVQLADAVFSAYRPTPRCSRGNWPDTCRCRASGCRARPRPRRRPRRYGAAGASGRPSRDRSPDRRASAVCNRRATRRSRRSTRRRATCSRLALAFFVRCSSAIRATVAWPRRPHAKRFCVAHSVAANASSRIGLFMFAVFSVHRGSAPFSIYTVPAEKSFLRDVTF